MSLPIEDYALISDCHSAALIGKNGSIDWLCFPRFDSPACFAALLGTEENGRWKISPAQDYQVSRNYVEDTVVLETTYVTTTGSCKLVDCMLINEAQPRLVRIVEGLHGSVKLSCELFIRFDYGSIVPWVRKHQEGNGFTAVAGSEAIVIDSAIPLHGKNLHTFADFTIEAGEKKSFVLSWYQSHLAVPSPIRDSGLEVHKTIQWWKAWSAKGTYQGFDSEGVKRSLLTLKALTYNPTGAIIAAATTSLPEHIGGVRNWDYRFSWLRDSSFTLLALLNAGYKDEAIHWNDWLMRAVAGTPSQVNIMYGLHGERRLTELELDWLSGYEGSRPVRIGNSAHSQFQLDVFGEVLASSHLANVHGIPLKENTWRIHKKMIEYVMEKWVEPDEGIWEVRGPRQHFTHSKMMAWVAINNAIELVKCSGRPGDIQEWIKARDLIHRDICEKGFNKKLNSFVQFYGSDELDSSLLLMTAFGFLPARDPRVVGTINAIQKGLMKDGLLLRYQNRTGIDGLPGVEGSFIACSFWLVRNLHELGRTSEASELYAFLQSLRNDVGLFSEEYSTVNKRLVGNFPQALSHIAQINAARNHKLPQT